MLRISAEPNTVMANTTRSILRMMHRYTWEIPMNR